MDEIAALVPAILRSRRILGKLVVLCEGDVLPVGEGGPPSPQMYGKLEQMPDANFYKNCIPRNWHNSRLPQFFNCGSRSQVLSTYDALLKTHHQDPENSYLTPEKLYALVDLDVQVAKLPTGYPWNTTEDVHAALYNNDAAVVDPSNDHRIWVTALIHKEAFFVLPSTAAAWMENTTVTAFLHEKPVELQTIHNAIAKSLKEDLDVTGFWEVVKTRLARFRAGPRLSCTDGATLSDVWLSAVEQANAEEYEALLKALLAVAKTKPVWNDIVPDPTQQPTIPAENFRDQLALKAAWHIATLTPQAHPLVGFFDWLKARR